MYDAIIGPIQGLSGDDISVVAGIIEISEFVLVACGFLVARLASLKHHAASKSLLALVMVPWGLLIQAIRWVTAAFNRWRNPHYKRFR